MSRCYVTSDLHLFSRRSNAHLHLEQLRETVRRADDLVLCGDIFDFKWSNYPTADATAKAAKEWLADLITQNPDCKIHYILGNHDHHPALIASLELLAKSTPSFSWHPYVHQIGSSVFLHGDVANIGMNSSRLQKYREKFGDHSTQGQIKNRLYDAAVASGLHCLTARLIYPLGRVLRRLTDYLDELGLNTKNGIRNVYFGHTHLFVSGVEYAGMKFHNGGATIPGLQYQILAADVSS